MRAGHLAAPAALVVALGLTGCAGASCDPAACKSAMQSDLASAMAGGASPTADATRPPACQGIPDSVAASLATDVLSTAMATTTTTTSTRQALEDACRAGMVFVRENNELHYQPAKCVGLTDSEVTQIAVDYFGSDVASAKVVQDY